LTLFLAGRGRQWGKNSSKSNTRTWGSSDGTSFSRSRSGGDSTTSGWSEGVHKRPLLNPDEIGRLLARVDDRRRPGYPGLVLALVPGEHPLLARRVNYFESPRFLGFFDPHPNHSPPPTLAELGNRTIQELSKMPGRLALFLREVFGVAARVTRTALVIGAIVGGAYFLRRYELPNFNPLQSLASIRSPAPGVATTSLEDLRSWGTISPSETDSVAFSPDGQTLASGLDDGTIRLSEATSGRLLHTLIGASGSVNCVAFSPDGHTLASGSENKLVRLWDIDNNPLKYTLVGHSRHVNSGAFSPDGRTLASGSDDGTIRFWDTASGQLVRTITAGVAVESVAFSPDGRILASGGGEYHPPQVQLWDTATGRLLRTLSGPSNMVLGVAFSPDGRVLASGGVDETVRLWDVASGSLMRTIKMNSVILFVAFSPDGRSVAAASMSLVFWDVASGRKLNTLDVPYVSLNSIAYSPDGRIVASGTAKGIKFWGVANAEEASR
jgi:WD40 repeat protein